MLRKRETLSGGEELPFEALLESLTVELGNAWGYEKADRQDVWTQAAYAILKNRLLLLLRRFLFRRLRAYSFLVAPSGAMQSDYDKLLQVLITSSRLHALPPVIQAAAARIAGWAFDSVERCRKRFMRDADAIAAAFGFRDQLASVASIQPAGDPHAGGETVIIVTLDTGTRVVYKPRRQDALRLLSGDFAIYLRESFGVAFRFPRAVHCSDCVWTEYIEEEVDTNTVPNQRALGGLLATAQLLGMTDLHSENVIFQLGGPILLDVETAFSAEDYSRESIVRLAGGEALLCNTPLLSSLLPVWTPGILGGFAFFAGLSGVGKRDWGRVIYSDVGTVKGSMRVASENQQDIRELCVDDLIIGFEEIARSAEEICKAFERYSGHVSSWLERRYVARSTAEYAAVLDSAISAIESFQDWHHFEEEINERLRLIPERMIRQEEVSSLACFDIPLLWERLAIDEVIHRIRGRAASLRRLDVASESISSASKSAWWTHEEVKLALKDRGTLNFCSDRT